jgi:hypothetical protein
MTCYYDMHLNETSKYLHNAHNRILKHPVRRELNFKVKQCEEVNCHSWRRICCRNASELDKVRVHTSSITLEVLLDRATQSG